MAEDFLDIQGKVEIYQAVHPIYEPKMGKKLPILLSKIL